MAMNNGSLLDDIPRGAGDKGPHEYQTPRARFPADDRVAAAPHLAYRPDGGLLLGTVKGRLIGTPVDEDRHMMLIAGSRAGKGVSIIVPALIEYQGSIMAIDVKGELASITARRRAEGLRQNVCVLDPFEITAEWCRPYRRSFNPLSILHLDNPYIIEDAGLIADALVIASSQDTHWDDSARSLIEGVLLFVATAAELDGMRNLVTVWRIIARGLPGMVDDDGDDVPPMDALKAAMFAHAEELAGDIGEAIEAAASDFFDRPPNERLSVLSTARRQMKFLGYPALRSVLQGHDFDLSELKTAAQGMTIYLCLPAGRMGTCSRWFRLFINLALEAMERHAAKPKIPVLLCLDEFPVLGHMRQIEDAAGQIAGFGVKLLICLQDLAQIKSLYQERWETFIGNSGAVVCFGNSDLTTLEFISKRLGKTSVLMDRSSPLTYLAERTGATGENWVVEVHDLMTLEEVAQFFGRDDEFRRCLVIRPGPAPLILQRVNYLSHATFRGKYDVWP